MSREFHEQQKIKITEKADEIVSALPNFAHKYFDSLKNKNMSEKTYLQYAYDIRCFFTWLKSSAGFKDTNIYSLKASDIFDVLDIEDVNEYIKTLEYVKNGNQRKITSPAYKARKISSLKSFIKYYNKINESKSNLADIIDSPKIPNKEIITVEKNDIKRLLNEVFNTQGLKEPYKTIRENTKYRDYAILVLLFTSGVRVSELVSMDLKDVDQDNGTIIIIRKGGNEAKIYCAPEFRTALSNYLPERDRLNSSGSEALFLSRQGNRMSQRSVEKLIKKYADCAGINKRTTPHSARRSFATNLYEQTGDIYLVSEALGHASIETSARHYANQSEKRKAQIAQYASTILEDK